MEKITEEQSQNMVNSIMDDLQKIGVLEKANPNQFKDFGLFIPQGKRLDAHSPAKRRINWTKDE